MATGRKVLVDCIPYDGGKSGISVYVREFLQEFSKLDVEITLLVEPGAESFFPGYSCISAPAWTKKPALSMLWHALILPLKIRSMGFDRMIITAANRRAMHWYPVSTIAVIHDLAQYHVEGKYSALRMFYLKKLLPGFVRRAQKIVAVSHSTANDLKKFWQIPDSKLSVFYNGVCKLAPFQGGWCEKFKLQKDKYILYVSRIEHPGKNHVALIKAFDRLPEALRKEYKLVIAGSPWQDSEEVYKTAEQSPSANQIVFTGFARAEDLREAYTNARMYIFPSRFEGFGLSLIEAMTCGTPCACSSNSSLGEIGQGAAVLFPPDDVEKMSAAIEQVLTDEALRGKLREAGFQKQSEYSWQKHAQAVFDLAFPPTAD